MNQFTTSIYVKNKIITFADENYARVIKKLFTIETTLLHMKKTIKTEILIILYSVTLMYKSCYVHGPGQRQAMLPIDLIP